jgi:hypothetical protein
VVLPVEVGPQITNSLFIYFIYPVLTIPRREDVDLGRGKCSAGLTAGTAIFRQRIIPKS